VQDVGDPHLQQLLRAHDEDVCALCVSRDGRFVASGQLGSQSRKGYEASVIVWEWASKARFLDLSGLNQKVVAMDFTDDGRFLCASGQNQMISVWSMETGERIYSRRTENVVTVVSMSPPFSTQGSRYPYYQMCTADGQNVLYHRIEFDLRSMSYALHSDRLALPASGLQRQYTCGTIRNGDYFIVATTAGDLCVFSLAHKIFRSSIPVCNGGITSLIQARDNVLFVGSGDGKIKGLQGDDVVWEVISDATLEFAQAAITSLSLSTDAVELISGTNNGKMYRVLTNDLSSMLLQASHTAPVTDVSFAPESSDTVATCSAAGEMFVWDLSTYAHIATSIVQSPARCLSYTRTPEEVLVGYDDGFVRAWDARPGCHGRLVWQLASVHRGAVTCICQSPNVIVTGGDDFVVRVWHRTTHEMLTQFGSKHRKPVSKVIMDEAIAHMFHSCSEDRSLISYDLKQNKAVVVHSMQAGNFTDMSQRKDHEKEILSVGLDGRLLFWDVDFADPVGCLTPSCPYMDGNSKLLCGQISPKGRYLACAGQEHLLYLFDLQTCEQIQALEGHSKAVVRMAWSPDEKQLVTVSQDSCVAVWNFFEVE
jgi:WD40 repeat protein